MAGMGGAFVFEKNRPATFKYPLYSFVSDWIMMKDMLTGKVSDNAAEPLAVPERVDD